MKGRKVVVLVALYTGPIKLTYRRREVFVAHRCYHGNSSCVKQMVEVSGGENREAENTT